MAAGASREQVMRYRRQLFARFERIATLAGAAGSGWLPIRRARGQDYAAVIHAPTGRRVELRMHVARASNGETHAWPLLRVYAAGVAPALLWAQTRPSWCLCGPGDDTPGAVARATCALLWPVTGPGHARRTLSPVSAADLLADLSAAVLDTAPTPEEN